MSKLIYFFIFLLLFINTAYSNDNISYNKSLWDKWIVDFKTEAVSDGLSLETVNSALANVKFVRRVIELDRHQPEFTMTFKNYLRRVTPDSRVKKGKALLIKHKDILDKVSKEFNVQPQYIVSLWGIETDFGKLTGGFNVIDSLATLAFEGRRAKYFRKELFNAIRILDENHITIDKMTGSWSGAMGQPQFMPSSFLNYAIDYNRDSKRDIWNTKADVFASIANYLQDVGWDGTSTWGREVKLPKNFNINYEKNKVIKKISYWQTQGVRRIDGADLPKRALDSQIITDKLDGRSFLVYGNYRAIMRWNRSNYFALSVGLLSDIISQN